MKCISWTTSLMAAVLCALLPILVFAQDQAGSGYTGFRAAAEFGGAFNLVNRTAHNQNGRVVMGLTAVWHRDGDSRFFMSAGMGFDIANNSGAPEPTLTDVQGRLGWKVGKNVFVGMGGALGELKEPGVSASALVTRLHLMVLEDHGWLLIGGHAGARTIHQIDPPKPTAVTAITPGSDFELILDIRLRVPISGKR